MPERVPSIVIVGEVSAAWQPLRPSEILLPAST
jgi:hypothetical protein